MLAGRQELQRSEGGHLEQGADIFSCHSRPRTLVMTEYLELDIWGREEVIWGAAGGPESSWK